jgi:hypothetical protein
MWQPGPGTSDTTSLLARLTALDEQSEYEQTDEDLQAEQWLRGTTRLRLLNVQRLIAAVEVTVEARREGLLAGGGRAGLRNRVPARRPTPTARRRRTVLPLGRVRPSGRRT